MIADQGELDDTIVDQMDLDDEEYRTFVQGRDGRVFENEDTIPQDWGNFVMDVLTVNDGHDSNWVYNQMEIISGQLFHDKKHLQHAVKKWSFLEKKPFKVVVSNLTTYDVKCLASGCPWRVQGYLPKAESNFVASIMVGHSCKLLETVVKHRNMTAKFVVIVLFGEIMKKTLISPLQIMFAISNRYSYEISYDIAWVLAITLRSHKTFLMFSKINMGLFVLVFRGSGRVQIR